MNRLELLQELKRRIEALPAVQDEIGMAGRAEEDIARMYENLGDAVAAGDWWVRAALTAEKFGQMIIGHQKLKIAQRRHPEHLGIRRELERLTDALKAAGVR